MRCVGCIRVIRSRVRRAESWDLFQLCPVCFDELVPEFYPKSIKARIVKYKR